MRPLDSSAFATAAGVFIPLTFAYAAGQIEAKGTLHGHCEGNGLAGVGSRVARRAHDLSIPYWERGLCTSGVSQRAQGCKVALAGNVRSRNCADIFALEGRKVHPGAARADSCNNGQRVGALQLERGRSDVWVAGCRRGRASGQEERHGTAPRPPVA